MAFAKRLIPLGALLVISLFLAGCSKDQAPQPTERENTFTVVNAALEDSIPTHTQTPPARRTPSPSSRSAGSVIPSATTPPPLKTEPTPTASPSALGLEAQASPALPASTHLPAEQWREWDYLPTLSARAAKIYRKGIERGNDPRHFSVVGDCQAIPLVFLGLYDRKEYTLPDGQEYLRETIDYYAGSFNREGMAVRGGYTAASILAPLQADPKVCQPGETPLDCEFRVYNPSIVFINLETWAKPATIDRYENYLRQIIEKTIEHGVLPILATKADAAEVGEGKHVINPIVAKLALEYDLPLWNFWRAAQQLPNKGIDPNREGFHLTQEGWDRKSLMALQTLDLIRRALNDELPGGEEPTATTLEVVATTPEGIATIPEGTATPEGVTTSEGIAPSERVITPTATRQLPTPTPRVTATALPLCIPGSAADCLLFGLVASQPDGSIKPAGVYLYEISSQQWVQVAPDGFDLQALSPDGKSMLINRGSELYTSPLEGGSPQKISDQFFDAGKLDAYWVKDGTAADSAAARGGRVILIANRSTYNAVWLYNLADSTWKALTAPGDDPIRLYASMSTEVVYWEKGSCSAKDFCTSAGVWYSPLDGSQFSKTFEGVSAPAFSPDDTHLAFMDANFKSKPSHLYNDYLLVETAGEPLLSRRWVQYSTGEGFMVHTRLLSYYWSPDSTRVLTLLDDYSDYFEKSLVLRPYTFDLPTGILLEYDKLYGPYGSLKPQAAWSPDSSRVMIVSANLVDTGELQLALYLLDFKTRAGQFLNPLLPGNTYQYVTNIHWIVR